MKKINAVCGVLLILASTVSIKSQTRNPHEFSLSYSFATQRKIEKNSHGLFYLVGGKYENRKLTGSIVASYKYAISNRWSVGGIFAYENIKADAVSEGILEGKNTWNFYSFAIEFDYRYLIREKIQLYSALGIGCDYSIQDYQARPGSLIKKSEDYECLTSHVTLLGFRYGKSFAFFAELGSGYKGLLNMGISYQF